MAAWPRLLRRFHRCGKEHPARLGLERPDDGGRDYRRLKASFDGALRRRLAHGNSRCGLCYYRWRIRHGAATFKNVFFSFGTGKVSVLGAYTSAIVLGGIALFMAGQSILRLLHPLPIQFNEAIAVACVGLTVNITSALLLKDHHHHSGAGHHHHHGPHHDLNLKAAYIHVLADAVTSMLAIVALTGGKLLGWVWLDPVMGLVGAAVITQWARVLFATPMLFYWTSSQRTPI